MAKELAIVLNNGSMNSAVTTALAAQRYRPVLLCVEDERLRAGQRRAYERQVAHFKPFRGHVAPLPPLAAADPIAPDLPAAGNLGSRLQRLLPLVSTAVRLAVHYRAAGVYLGIRVGGQPEELAQLTEYVQIWNELLQLPCGLERLEVMAPLADLEPWQVIDAGSLVSAPFDCTWSCLEDGQQPCGACRGCRNRQSAFVQAAKADPLAEPRGGLQRAV